MLRPDEETIGGRIRKCRKASGLKIKEFAPEIDVTPNYLSMVERNERTPSAALLQKIAKIGNVSYSWLLTGAVPHAASISPKNLNLQLFLFLVMARAPGATKENLSVLLMTSPETIDGILAGDSMDYSPQWVNILPALAHRMDISAVRQELKVLDAFLEKEEDSMNREALFKALQLHITNRAEEKRDYKIYGPIENYEIPYVINGNEVCMAVASRMTLRNKDSLGDFCYLDYLPILPSIRQETVDEILMERIDFAEKMGIGDRLLIVLTDKDVFDLFCSCASNYQDYHDLQYEDLTGSCTPAFCGNIVLVQIDDTTGKIIAEETLDDTHYYEI